LWRDSPATLSWCNRDIFRGYYFWAMPGVPSLMIYKLSPAGYFTFVNGPAADFFAAQPEDLVGRHYLDFVHPDWREKVQAFYQGQIAQGATSAYFEFPVPEHQGTLRWVGQSTEIVYQAGETVEILAFSRDISAQKDTEEKLRKTELRLQHLLRNLPVGILVEDESRRVVYTNREFCRLFHIPLEPEELRGEDCAQLAVEAAQAFASPEEIARQTERVLEKKEAQLRERWPLADGRIFSRDYLPIADGKHFLGNLWQYRDVTEEELRKQRIRESEERYRRIIENINLGLLEVDQEHRITYANASFSRLSGYPQAELLGQYADRLLLWPDDTSTKKELDSINAARLAGESSAYEVRLRHKDGRAVWVIISGTPIYNAQGEAIGSLGIHHDISIRKEEELERKELLEKMQQINSRLTNQRSALEDSQLKLRKILDFAMDAVITIDEEGKVCDWNQMAEKTFGYRAEEALGSKLSQLIIPDKYREAHEAGMQHYLATGEGPVLNKRIEIVGKNKAQEHFPVEVTIVPIPLQGRTLFSAFVRDITQRKQSEADMERALEEQKKLSRLRSRFVSMTSHELRTPLTTIKTNLELLQYHLGQNPIPPPIKRNLERISRESLKLENLMNDILTLGKVEEGKMEYRPQPTDLLDFCTELLGKSFQPWRDGRWARFRLKGAPRMIVLDQHLLGYMLENLLVNAFKYSPGKEPPEVELHFTDLGVKLSVSDEGIGIPEEEQDQVFTSFYRASNTDSIEGTGMGLSIVKQFAEIQGAKLSLLSALGQGTQLSIYFADNAL